MRDRILGRSCDAPGDRSGRIAAVLVEDMRRMIGGVSVTSNGSGT